MKNKLPASLKGKVLITTAVGLITILVIYLSIDRAFEKITTNIDHLSKPNERLLEVNRLFRSVSQLNHLQQKEAASGRRDPSMSFIKESDAVYESLDTLQWLFSGDSIQLQRVESIDQLLTQRREVFVEYLELQYRRNASPNIRSFLTRVAEETRTADSLAKSRLLQTHKTITTTTVSDTIREERTGFFQRLFGRSEPSADSSVVTTATEVHEEVVVAVDTIGHVRVDSLFTILESSLDSIQTIQLQEAALLQQREFQLLTVNNSLIHQMINIINALEQEEVGRLNEETQEAFQTAGDTIHILNLIAGVFIAVSLLLVLIVLLDISKSNKYRAELEVISEAMRKEAASKQRFLSNMSHEIRTPLQSIYGYAEQAKLAGSDTVEVNAIYHPAAHLLSVVNEVLDYAKVTSGQFTFDSKPFDLVQEIDHVVNALIPLAAKKGIVLTNETKEAGGFGQMEGDAFRLRQILFNLIGNAIKFTDEGWVKVEVTLVDKQDSYGVIIAIRDTGVGIEADQLSQLFKEYAQGGNDVSEKYGGTGLGLSIVKSMVELQGGTIQVDSEPGEGSCFTVFIPYKSIVKQSVLKGDAKETAIVTLKSGIVWMADDDALILNLGASILKKHGVEHRVFPNGQELLKAFDKEKPDMIFLDMRMPGMSGLEVCERLRHRAGRDIRIYALTAQVLSHEQSELLERGFDGIVMKPFRESDLLVALEGSVNESVVDVDVDVSGLAKMTGNNVEEITDILLIVRDETVKDLVAMDVALANLNQKELVLLVHRLAGRVGQTGALKYAMLLRDVEGVLRRPSTEIDKEEIVRMIQMGHGFVNTLEDLLSTTYKV